MVNFASPTRSRHLQIAIRRDRLRAATRPRLRAVLFPGLLSRTLGRDRSALCETRSSCDFAMPETLVVLRECKGDDNDWDLTQVPSLLAAARGREFDAIAREFGEDLLLDAANKNNHALVRTLVQGFGVGISWKSAELPTCEAASKGHVDALEALLESGVPQFDVNARNAWSYAPIHAACSGRQPTAVEFLLTRGARKNAALMDGYSAAALAIVKGCDLCLRALLRAGAEPSAVCRLGDHDWSLVELATLRGRPVAIEMLLRAQQGRWIDAMYLGRALSISSSRHSLPTIPTLLLNAGADIEFMDDDVSSPPFYGAALKGKTKLARVYVGMYGQCILERVNYWCSGIAPICETEREELEFVRFLLRIGFPIRVCSDSAPVWTRAVLAHDNVALLRYLVRSGMQVLGEKKVAMELPLASAAFEGAPQCVKFLIGAGADVNDPLSTWLPLVGALFSDSTHIAQQLLKAGARLDAWGRNERNPLQQYSAASELFHLVRAENPTRLHVFGHLSRLGDVNCATSSTRSAFYLCVLGGLTREVQILIQECGADVNRQQPGDGFAPLMASVFADSLECCMSLLDAGADVNLRTFAAAKPCFLPGMDAFLCAAFRCLPAFISKLIEHGAKVSSRDSGGRGAVWLALHGSANANAVYEAEATVDVLLDHGALIDCCEAATGLRSIHVAANEGCFRALGALVTNGADVNCMDNAGNTALHWAVLGFCPAGAFLSNLVRDFGAGVSLKNVHGETALHVAARRCAGDDVSALLDVGSDVDARDKLGRTPLMLACGACPVEIPAEDWDNGSSVKRRPFLPSNMVEILVRRGADVSLVSARGMGALHFASLAGHVSICRYLLLFTNTKPAGRNRCHRTPLHLACRHGHASVAEVLISKGAKVDARDSKGRTPLFEAASRGHSDCVSLLLKSNADAGAVCGRGQTSLSEATRLGRNSIVRILVSQQAKSNVCRCSDAQMPYSEAASRENLFLVGGAGALLDGSCL
jgi:uncharacterized protein